MGCLMVLSEMELLLFLSLFILSWSGETFVDESGSTFKKIAVKEDEDAILPCSLDQENITNELFDWKKIDKGTKEVFFYQGEGNRFGFQDEQFKNRVLYFPGRLPFGNASIIIRTTKVADSGNYTCDFPGHQPITRSKIELIVGVVSKPSITTLEETQDSELLQCEVLGASPKPKVFWQDSSGNIIPAKEPQVKDKGGRYDIILQTTVTKTDTYRCVATQEEINHQISEKTYVGFSEFPTGLVVGIAVCVLLVGIGLGVLVERRFIKPRQHTEYTTGVHTAPI